MARIKLFNFFEYEWLRKSDQEERSTTWDLKGDTLLDIIDKNTGNDVTKKTSLKFSAVMAAVSLNANFLAASPIVIYDNLKGGGREANYKDPLYKILAYQPNAYMNAFTFWELMSTHLDLWGNSFAFISRYGGKVNALTPVFPEHVTIITEGGRLIYRVEGTGDKVLDKDHSPDKFLHFKDISFDGIIGISRIDYAKRAISLGVSAEKFSKEFFDKGGHAKGVIEVPGTLGDEGYAIFKKRWDANANHGTPVLDNGKTYKQLNMPIEDAMFISARQFQVQDIARIFGLPPHAIGDLSRATFTNIEHQSIDMVRNHTRPRVKRFEHEMENKLMGDSLGQKSIRFNLEGILRGDTATRGEYLSKMVQSKIMNRNEARAVENLNPVEGGDVFENPATSTNNKIKENE